MSELIEKYSPQAIANIQTIEDAKDGYEKLKTLVSYLRDDYEQAFSLSVASLECFCRLGEIIEEMQERGELAVQGKRKNGKVSNVEGNDVSNVEGNDVSTLRDFGITRDLSSQSQKAKSVPLEQREKYYNESLNTEDFPNKTGLLKMAKKLSKDAKTQKSVEDLREEVETKSQPIITLSDALAFLDSVDSFDLLLTDPPYLTDVDDINKFAEWLPVALKKLKPTGRAYVFVGAYPPELQAYFNQAMPNQVLVWTYRNTIGPDRAKEYKSNWQAILYYIGKDAPPLKGDMLKEKFSVLDFNAPDGRHDKRWHAWEKPLNLAEHLILQSTNEGDIIIDPFAGTGTFLLAGGKLGRIAKGCDSKQSQIDIAIERGCKFE